MLLRDDTPAVSNGIHITTSSDNADKSAYDVIIVGGGLAGIGAAIGAKQASPTSSVLIVESEGCLGGAATHRGVLSFCGLYSVEAEPRRAVGAIWTEIHERLVEQRAAAEVPDQIVAYVQVIERRLRLQDPCADMATRISILKVSNMSSMT